MKRWRAAMLRVTLMVLAVVPAYCQRGTIGVEGGQTSERFAALPRLTTGEGILEGEVIVLKSKDKLYGADVLAGGEVRIPGNTNTHAKEYALYGGAAFHFGHSLSAGFHVQAHRIYLPTSFNLPPGIWNQTNFYRPRLSLLELPGFVQYKFGPEHRLFVRAEGGPELAPRYHYTIPTGLPNPNLDHGYTVRGSVGYMFNKWYLKGTYETRYFKFRPNLGNPGNLYNWRTDTVMGGVGLVF